jgi:Icc-related predicted phosphoesterase
MDITFISDSHGKHYQISKEHLSGGKILCHTGDVSNRGLKSEIIDFLTWFSKLPYEHLIFISGNHDWFFEKASENEINELLSEFPNIIYLNDSGVEIEGLKFWGSPVQPWFYDWAFNKRGGEIIKHWDIIPEDTQVLLTHGPIKGYLDIVPSGEHAGCPYLLHKVLTLDKLLVHASGHLHSGYGQTMLGNTKLINSAVLNEQYMYVNLPIVIEI